MAMTDYPTANSFLNPMPAWPIVESCKAFKDIAPPSQNKPKAPSNGLTDEEKKYLRGLNDAANIYFNYTN